MVPAAATACPFDVMHLLSCIMHVVLLKALLPVCMKYTARDESRVENICSMK